MECDRCGAERPRTGPCPECGAPPPAPFSSQRGQRGSGRSQPGGASSGSRRSSDAKRGSGGGLFSRGGGSRQGGQDEESWDDWGAEPPSRQGGRFGSGTNYGAYDEDAESRALVPQYGQPMPPSAESEMGGVPGFPQTDEEERALGIRRPVYIPATDEKRKRKINSWRVVSGVMSVMLVCVAACAGAGFLGQRQIAKLFPGPAKTILQTPTVDLTGIPGTPVSTPGPAAKHVTSLVTAQKVDASYNPEDITSIFTVKSTVYAVVTIVGVSSGTNTLSCEWYLDGQNFNLKGNGTQITVQPTKTTNFHGYCALPYLQTGTGMVRIYWNRPASDTSEDPKDKYLAQTIKFAVVAQLPGTPGKGTPGAGTATPKKASTDIWQIADRRISQFGAS